MAPPISIQICYDHILHQIQYISGYDHVLQGIHFCLTQVMHVNEVIIYNVYHNKEKYIVNATG